MGSTKPESKLSPKERALIALVPKDGTKITSSALVVAYYPAGGVPLNAQQIVVGRLRRIMQKVNGDGGPTRLRKSERAGPKPISYWIERL